MGGKARVSLWQDDVTGVPEGFLLGKPMFFLSLQKYERQISFANITAWLSNYGKPGGSPALPIPTPMCKSYMTCVQLCSI